MRAKISGVIVVIAVLLLIATTAGRASALPSVDDVVPTPNYDVAQAMLPTPTGDPFFDRTPPGLASMKPGQVIAIRDVSWLGKVFTLWQAQRVVQVKFRSTDAKGRPSYGTATIIMPPGDITNRPVLVNNLPIDALGAKCTPSYALAHGYDPLTTSATDYVPPMTFLAIKRGYVVLLPDHQGPKMAYAEPVVAGHMILDAVRAMRSVEPALAESRFGMTGYSGGAIATNGAAKLLLEYAPELARQAVGAALGGTPVDARVLVGSMSSWYNWAKGLFVAGVYGISRENPEILDGVNNLGKWAAPIFRDLCTVPAAMLGPLTIPVEAVSAIPDPFRSSLAQKIYRHFNMPGKRYGMPMYVYNGAQEFWIPAIMAQDLYAEQCRLGTRAVLRLAPGEHAIAAVTGLPGALQWLDARLQGVPAPNEC